MTIVDMQRRLESAEDIVAQMMAAETMPVTAAGAYALVTAIMALEPFSASVGMASFMESAARPSSVGKIAMAAIRTAETSEARWAVFSSFADSKRETISGPERKVQK